MIPARSRSRPWASQLSEVSRLSSRPRCAVSGPRTSTTGTSHIRMPPPLGAVPGNELAFAGDLEREIEQWLAVKKAASDAIVANGGTISHHHGVGTDHLPWLRQEKGPVGMAILRSMKERVDPVGVLNPGKLVG